MQEMSRRVFKWLIVLALGLAAASAALLFLGNSSFSEGSVKLDIGGPTQTSVGDEVIYKVEYENGTKSALKNMRLSFTYPSGAVILRDGEVIDNPSHVETLVEQPLTPGQKREKEFHMFLVGDKGNIKTPKVKLEFEAEGIQSRFEKTASAATTITDVPIALTLSAPPNAVVGDLVTYVLDYRNQFADQASGLRAVFAYPDGFALRSTTPAAGSGSTWNLKTLKKGEGGRISITGTLAGREGESKTVTVALQRNIGGKYVDYERASVATIIASPLLSLVVTVNGSRDYIAHPGDTLQYELEYRNASTFALNGLRLAMHLDGEMFDLASVDGKGGFFDSGSGTIAWDASVLANLESLRPNQAGLAKLTVKLKPTLTGGGSKSLFVRAVSQLGTDQVPDRIDASEIKVQHELVTKITTQPAFEQKLYYDDPAFGSAGPMPPQAGLETVFTVHWRITNPGNALSGAKIVGTLPAGVTWKNVSGVPASLTQPTYNKNAAQVIWNLGSVPQGVGVSNDKYEIAFQVRVKPSSNQIGSQVILLKSPALSGTDSFTGQAIVVTGADLTTNDTVDKPQQGTVQ